MLPITSNESISDIIRGYIIEKFVYRYNGVIAYHNNKVYNNNNNFLNNSNILRKKKYYYIQIKFLI